MKKFTLHYFRFCLVFPIPFLFKVSYWREVPIFFPFHFLFTALPCFPLQSAVNVASACLIQLFAMCQMIPPPFTLLHDRPQKRKVCVAIAQDFQSKFLSENFSNECSLKLHRGILSDECQRRTCLFLTRHFSYKHAVYLSTLKFLMARENVVMENGSIIRNFVEKKKCLYSIFFFKLPPRLYVFRLVQR